MKNKKGQDLSTSTIILLILGVVVLVVLVLGFTIGWEKIAPWLSSDNVNTIVNQCQIACTTSDVYGYCTMERTLKTSGLPGDAKEVKNSCKFFADDSNYLKYNVGKCPELCASA
jgi:hypothetical protein